MADDDKPAPAPKFDAKKLAAQIRGATEGDANALINEAYARVFAGDLGRLVLAHHLMECGVGSIFGPEASDQQLRYQAGRHDSAIMLANTAGYDAAAISTAVLSDTLEEPEDERRRSWIPNEHDEF